MMFKAFDDVIKAVRASKKKIINVDNAAAKLHYRITCWLLLLFTALVGFKQYFGEYVQCVHGTAVPAKVVNTFCFFTSTYTVISPDGVPGMRSAYRGVSPHTKESKIVRHAYYQWVPFVLFGQAMLFYLPHLIWKTCENGTVRNLVTGLRPLCLRLSCADDASLSNYYVDGTRIPTEKIRQICGWYRMSTRMKVNRLWAWKLIAFECLNLCNVLTQIYVTELFLGDNFISLGQRMWSSKGGGGAVGVGLADNPLEIVFPKMTKCDFYKYGASGTIEVHDALCVMTLNVVNEVIYAIFWCWLAILTPITICALMWRVVSFASYRCSRFNRYMLAKIIHTVPDAKVVKILSEQPSYSDWLLLCYLGSNVDPYLFVKLLRSMRTPDDDVGDTRDEMKSNSEDDDLSNSASPPRGKNVNVKICS